MDFRASLLLFGRRLAKALTVHERSGGEEDRDQEARDSWLAFMRHIAVEGRCFVLSCNQFNRRRDFPADYRTRFGDDPDVVVTRGGSCIVDPFGKVLAGPETEGEAILVAEVDRAQIVRGKFDLDVVGHYARPDIFQLHVDERPKQPVTTVRGEGTTEPAGA